MEAILRGGSEAIQEHTHEFKPALSRAVLNLIIYPVIQRILEAIEFQTRNALTSNLKKALCLLILCLLAECWGKLFLSNFFATV